MAFSGRRVDLSEQDAPRPYRRKGSDEFLPRFLVLLNVNATPCGLFFGTSVDYVIVVLMEPVGVGFRLPETIMFFQLLL